MITGFERIRLWFSLQRYALLEALGAAILSALAVIFRSPWLVLPAALAVLGLLSHAALVASRYPRKRRAVERAAARIRAGEFKEESVEKYLIDPCYRLVALEILCMAGTSRERRKEILRR